MRPALLLYSATARCKCGAGLAYHQFLEGEKQAWQCSAVRIGEVPDGGEHDVFPFAFYEIKSEDQPSAYGATTRPVPLTEGDKAERELIQLRKCAALVQEKIEKAAAELADLQRQCAAALAKCDALGVETA